jgi:hypothetical protein
LGRIALALPGSVTCGACFGFLHGLGMFMGHAETVLGGDAAKFLVAGAVYGAWVGAASFPLLIGVTTSVRTGTGFATVLGATGAFTFLAGLFLSAEEFGVGVALTLIAYGCACLGWRVFDGSGGYEVVTGRCPGCGYDLHGLSAGPCPECGHALDP